MVTLATEYTETSTRFKEHRLNWNQTLWANKLTCHHNTLLNCTMILYIYNYYTSDVMYFYEWFSVVVASIDSSCIMCEWVKCRVCDHSVTTTAGGSGGCSERIVSLTRPHLWNTTTMYINKNFNNQYMLWLKNSMLLCMS